MIASGSGSKDFLPSFVADLPTVEAGVPLATLSRFAEESGLPMRDLYPVIIAARTLKHRRERNEALSRDESDKLARVVRLFRMAIHTFGEPARATRWFRSSKERFGGRSPLAMLSTEMGGRMVEELIIQIDEGMFA